MKKLKYKLTNDMLFRILFIKYPELLKRLVSDLLRIRFESITQFEIRNPEIPPEALGDKFCRLDILMVVDGQRVDLEIQVRDEGDYPERVLYYWAREYSSALAESEDYIQLPRVIIISIVNFKLFDCTEFRSEFVPLEVTRHTALSDKMGLLFFELPKLPPKINAGSGTELWLNLFNAKTEEDLRKIEGLGVPVMEQAVTAYRHVAASPEFRELERLRSKARHDEASALRNARMKERVKWEGIVADKDAALAGKDSEIEKLRVLLAEMQAKMGSGSDRF